MKPLNDITKDEFIKKNKETLLRKKKNIEMLRPVLEKDSIRMRSHDISANKQETRQTKIEILLFTPN